MKNWESVKSTKEFTWLVSASISYHVNRKSQTLQGPENYLTSVLGISVYPKNSPIGNTQK